MFWFVHKDLVEEPNFTLLQNLLHSLMWFTVSFLFPHNLHLLFSCILSGVAWMKVVHMALFCAPLKRNSISLLRLIFFNRLHVSLFAITKVYRLNYRYSKCLLISVFFSACFHIPTTVTGCCNYFLCFNYHYPIRGFPISVTWWFFTGVWVTTSLLKSPGLFLVFWMFSIM